MCPRLSLRDDFPQERFQRIHVVVLEPSDTGTTESRTETDRRVIKFVRNDQAAFADQSGDGGGICSETHGADHGGFGAYESSHKLFSLDVQVGCRGIVTGSSTGYPVSSNGSFGSIGTSTGGRCETEVIVGRNVERAGGTASQRECVVFIDRGSIETYDGTSCDTSDRPSKALVQTLLQSTRVK